MATSRSRGCTSLTRWSSMRSSPSVTDSSPATIRSRVDLPHPDGPTSTRNSPSPMRRSAPWITSTSPYRFTTDWNSTVATVGAYSRRGAVDHHLYTRVV